MASEFPPAAGVNRLDELQREAQLHLRVNLFQGSLYVAAVRGVVQLPNDLLLLRPCQLRHLLSDR
jgi:hypothetical protein